MGNIRKVQVIVYRLTKGKPEFLLLRRPGPDSFWQGVTGGVEIHDASLHEAAVRELREELGVHADPDRLEGPLHEFEFVRRRPGDHDQVAHEYCFAYCLRDGEEPRLSVEHDQMVWLPHKAAHERIAHDDSKKVLDIVALQYE
jgi:8-oxo-dGTP pyrophosphatase MutT (NUDIX family)